MLVIFMVFMGCKKNDVKSQYNANFLCFFYRLKNKTPALSILCNIGHYCFQKNLIKVIQ